MENSLNTNNANNETGDKTVALRISSPVISTFREKKIYDLLSNTLKMIFKLFVSIHTYITYHEEEEEKQKKKKKHRPNIMDLFICFWCV